jgi:hypothetical protein
LHVGLNTLCLPIVQTCARLSDVNIYFDTYFNKTNLQKTPLICTCVHVAGHSTRVSFPYVTDLLLHQCRSNAIYFTTRNLEPTFVKRAHFVFYLYVLRSHVLKIPCT